MSWTVVVPFKSPGLRKTRLAPFLRHAERDRLAAAMFRHVTTTLAGGGVEVIVLAETAPEGWNGRWMQDGGAGLNSELISLQRLLPFRWAVVHGDLPLLGLADVGALFSAAWWSGIAFGSDRHGSGTNALAVADERELVFHFGCESLEKFVRDAGERFEIVRRRGLELDVDTYEDLIT